MIIIALEHVIPFVQINVQVVVTVLVVIAVEQVVREKVTISMKHDFSDIQSRREFFKNSGKLI